jgi:hypothetical protein
MFICFCFRSVLYNIHVVLFSDWTAQILYVKVDRKLLLIMGISIYEAKFTSFKVSEVIPAPSALQSTMGKLTPRN